MVHKIESDIHFGLEDLVEIFNSFTIQFTGAKLKRYDFAIYHGDIANQICDNYQMRLIRFIDSYNHIKNGGKDVPLRLYYADHGFVMERISDKNEHTMKDISDEKIKLLEKEKCLVMNVYDGFKKIDEALFKGACTMKDVSELRKMRNSYIEETYKALYAISEFHKSDELPPFHIYEGKLDFYESAIRRNQFYVSIHRLIFQFATNKKVISKLNELECIRYRIEMY